MLQQRIHQADLARSSGDPNQIVPANLALIATGLHAMGNLRSVEGVYPQAVVLYKDSLEIEQTPEALLALGTAEAEAGNFDEAIKLAKQVQRDSPDNLQALRVLSSSLLQKGDYAQALIPLTRLQQLAPSVENQYAVANCLLETKRPEDKAKAQAIFRQIAAEHGDSGSLHVLTGRAYRDAGDLPAAAAEFQRALEIDPHTPHAHYFLGLAKLSMNEWRSTPEAADQIQQEAALFPQDYLANYMSGFLASEDRRYPAAEKYLKAAIAIDPTSPDPWLYLGLDAYAQSDNAAAEPALRKAVQLTGNDASRANYQIRRAYVDLGRILSNEGRKEEAEPFLLKARELQDKTMEQSQQSIASMAGASSNAAAVMTLNRAGSAAGSEANLDETKSFDALSADTPAQLTPQQKEQLQQREKQLRAVLALAYNDLGTVQARQGRYVQAAGLYSKAEDWDASLPGLEKNLGQSEFRAGAYEAAISPFTQALLAEPGNRALRAMLGISYFDLNRFGEAVQAFTPLGRDGMQDEQVGYAWAASLAHQGEVAPAASVLQVYMEHGQTPEIDLLVGQVWTAIGDYPKAVATFEQALRANPALPKAHLYLGLAYIHAGQWAPAAEQLKAELAANPGDPDALYHLGFVDLQIAKPEDARRLFQQVIAAHPEYANAQYQLGKLELEGGEVPQAVTHLETAERESPHTDYIHYQLQAAYRKANRGQDADRELAVYKQLKADARQQAADRITIH